MLDDEFLSILLTQHDRVKGQAGVPVPITASLEREQAPLVTVSATILTVFLICIFSLIGEAKCVAVIAPDGSEQAREIAGLLGDGLKDVNPIDADMAAAAFKAVAPVNTFNMTVAEGKRVGQVIGCEYFVLVRSDTIRRNSSTRTEYYEAFAAVYTVSSRTGRLVDWRLVKHDGVRPEAARTQLTASAARTGSQLIDILTSVSRREFAEKEPPAMEEPPADDSPMAKDFHPPLPYRRVRPEYTPDADLHSIEATVEIVADIDDKGTILRTEIVRWAGYGLDESVEKTVRGMTWRPADRRGKSLPMRILLRYNFKKVAKN